MIATLATPFNQAFYHQEASLRDTSKEPYKGPMQSASFTPQNYGTKVASTVEHAIPGSVVLFAPMLEELTLRGIVFACMLPFTGFLPAATVSSVWFGLLHTSADDRSYLPVTETIFGFVCAGLYARSGSLLLPIAYHCGNNVWAAIFKLSESLGERLYYYCGTMGFLGESYSEVENYGLDVSLMERLTWNMTNSDAVEQYVCWFAEMTELHKRKEDYLMLPTDWSDEEIVEQSPFFNKETRQMVTIGEFKSKCGWDTEHDDQQLIESYLDSVFKGRDSISVAEWVEAKTELLGLEAGLHLLATRPEIFAKKDKNMINQAYGAILMEKLVETMGDSLISYKYPNGLVCRAKVEQSIARIWKYKVLASHTLREMLAMDMMQNGDASLLKKFIESTKPAAKANSERDYNQL